MVMMMMMVMMCFGKSMDMRDVVGGRDGEQGAGDEVWGEGLSHPQVLQGRSCPGTRVTNHGLSDSKGSCTLSHSLTSQDYTGGRTADTIISWLNKKSAGIPKLESEVP